MTPQEYSAFYDALNIITDYYLTRDAEMVEAYKEFKCELNPDMQDELAATIVDSMEKDVKHLQAAIITLKRILGQDSALVK